LPSSSIFASSQAASRFDWKRDPVDVFAFHVDVPAGASEVVAKFIHTSPLRESEGRITMTREMLNLQWEKMSLYPAGHYVRQIKVKPTVTLPAGLDGVHRARWQGAKRQHRELGRDRLRNAGRFADLRRALCAAA